MKIKEIRMKLLTAAVGAVTIAWIVHPLFMPEKIEEPQYVRFYEERDIETLVYGHDPETDFVPGVYTGGLVISPEDDFYNSLELMAKVVEAEAGNQGLLGKRMVADVILNRVRDDNFPDTIVDVIYQKNAFAVISNGMYEQVDVSEETWTAIFMEMEKVSYPDLFYFCNSGFHKYGTPWDKVGDHYFNTK